MTDTVLEVTDLRTYFKTRSGVARAVDGVSFAIPSGGTFALVGESGCGKSITALSLMGLVPEPAGYIAGGSVRLSGVDVTALSEAEKRRMRGNRMSMIFQEPMTSLNPVFTVGEQTAEVIRLHQKKNRREARDLTAEMFAHVGLPEPARLYDEYPHRLSGGMRQRVMIAMALACRPELLIADEPTTALDVTIQAQIIELIKAMKEELGTAVLLITHNMALVYRNADSVGVMYAGKIVETAPTATLFRNPMHPYTIKLLSSMPAVTKRGHELDTIPGSVPPATAFPEGCRFSGRCPREMAGCAAAEPALREVAPGHMAACHLHDAAFMQGPGAKALRHGIAAPAALSTHAREREPILEVRGLKTHYPVRSGVFKRITGYVRAVDGVDFTVRRGSTLALVGESGCGKTTTGKTLIRLIQPTAGVIMFKGRDVATMPEAELKPLRSAMQIIFQDPYSSLNPRLTVKDIIEEGLLSLRPGLTPAKRIAKIASTLDLVGLSADMMRRYPHEFSGGQRQRIGIARAVAVDPEFIICDEAVSALDVSVQAQILNLLKFIQRNTGISFLFITHDLGVVEYIADEVAVMYEGRIVEHNECEALFRDPRHEYTQKLLAAIPRIDDTDGKAEDASSD